MGRATREANKARLEMIERHMAWARRQDPLVRALAAYADGCRVFAPTPTTEWAAGHIYHPIFQAVLAPDICEESVTIPAGYRKIIAADDHGAIIAAMPRTAGGRRIEDSYYLELADGLQVVLPGGALAKLTVDAGGRAHLVESDPAAPAPVAAATPATDPVDPPKTARKPRRKAPAAM